MEKDLKTRELSQCTFKPTVNPKSARIVGELEAKMRESQAERWASEDRGVIEILPVPLESERTLASRHEDLGLGSTRILSYQLGYKTDYPSSSPSQRPL